MRFAIPLLLVPAIARAQPAGAQAESLFDAARASMAQHKYAEACASFEASEKLEAATTTVVNLADCREKNGQLASAWGLYLQAERELRSLSDDTATKLRETMKQRAAALAPTLSKLTIHVSETNRTDGLEVIRDNDRLDQGAWNQALPIDGGTYKISARAPNHREWSTTVTVRTSGDVQVVDVPALGVTQAETTPAPTTEAVDEPEPHTVPAPNRYVPIVVGSAAVTVGVVAILLEVAARSTYSDAQALPNGDDQTNRWYSANTKRYVAEGLGVVAIGGAAGALYLYLRERNSTDGIAFTPTVSSNGAGIAYGATF